MTWFDYPSAKLTVNSSPSRGRISLHPQGQPMIELTPFDAEELGRTLIDLADSCLTAEKYRPADDAARIKDLHRKHLLELGESCEACEQYAAELISRAEWLRRTGQAF